MTPREPERTATTADPARVAYIKGLRQLADILEQNPGLEVPADGSRVPLGFSFWGEDAPEQLATAARALPGRWDKQVDDTYLRLYGQLAGLHISVTAYRDAVCTRRVTGTEEREVEEEITPAVTRKVRKKVDVVEWDCAPLLAGGESRG